jgi:putative tryptophan/tyrosine transport system substrate-binding protein
MIGRRKFITLLGSVAGAPPMLAPLATRAQQQVMPVIGLLSGTSFSDTRKSAFGQGLKEEGVVEGRNVAIEYRYAEGKLDRLPALAAELIQRRVTVIVAGPAADAAAKAATATVPIVFMSGVDPVRRGLVSSLNRPGGNLTGVTMFADDLEAKRIGLLHEMVPRATSIAVLVDTTVFPAPYQVQQVQAAGRSFGLPIRIMSIGSERDYDGAFATVAREQIGALLVTASINFIPVRERLTALAASYAIPAMYDLREFAEVGGLMSYAPNVLEAYRQVGIYTGRILKGEKPADLPVILPTKFEFVINLKTAKALGLEVPPMLLAIANDVID